MVAAFTRLLTEAAVGTSRDRMDRIEDVDTVTADLLHGVVAGLEENRLDGSRAGGVDALPVEREEEERPEEDEVHAGLLERCPPREDGERRDDDGDREEDHLHRAETEDERAVEPDRGDGDRRNRRGAMLAIAEPNARLKLVCTRSWRALRNAASVSGNRTRSAITTPTAEWGAPIASTASSIAGDSVFARPTTATSATTSRPRLASGARFDGRAACPFRILGRGPAAGVVAMPDRLDNQEQAVQRDRRHRGESELRG